MIYNKLMRDGIPALIQASDKKFEMKTLDEEAYRQALQQKLGEEVAEYEVSQDIAELADLVEVVYALVFQGGSSLEEFDAIRKSKLEERGGFEKRLLLVSVED